MRAVVMGCDHPERTSPRGCQADLARGSDGRFLPGQVWDRELLEEIAEVAGVDETTVRRNVRRLVAGIGGQLVRPPHP